ncbi:PfkB family carbohydrate kinase [Sphaerisporangium perillae]|uniref:PfkB family carbohydrate kinase n=1 Tax=Sphaerisporangium perillae TaxID=2935860 RepID=UPI00200BD4A8|nr:PfkB family carbohydrate kinase [Sphaerisporangium perillae]
MTPRALFAGLCTLDLVQSVERMPSANEKVTALRQSVAAGGPATNAAVAFSFLGGSATLLSAVGAHPLAAGIRADLAEYGVRLVDLTPEAADPPTMSTIMVTRGSGDRAVVSVNAAGRRLRPPPDLAELVAAHQVVHLDGHHPDLALAAARLAREQGRLTVLDGGSWKPGTAELLPYVDVAVTSADFHPPGTRTPEDTLAHLRAAGVPWAAVSRGDAPVMWQGPGEARFRPVPAVDVVDTLGAGDVLHGALTFALSRLLAGGPAAVSPAGRLTGDTFAAALDFAIPVASASCRSFGTRSWMRRQQRGTRRT